MGVFKRLKRKARNSVKKAKRINKRVGRKTRGLRKAVGKVGNLVEVVPGVGDVVSRGRKLVRMGQKVSKSLAGQKRKARRPVKLSSSGRRVSSFQPVRVAESSKPRRTGIAGFLANLFGF